jgi:hypothetical protein
MGRFSFPRKLAARSVVRRFARLFLEQLEEREVLSGIGPDGFGYVGNAVPFQNINLQPGDPGVFTIVPDGDYGVGAVNLGANTLNFYGQTYTGANQLWVSGKGLITFGSADGDYRNTDLTSSPLLVGGFYGFGERGDQAGGLFWRPRGAVELVRQAAAGNILQREKRQPLVLPDAIDLHDVRMLHPSDGLGFAAEAKQTVLGGMFSGQDHLEGHEAIELHLPGLVNHAHAAPAQNLQDVVARNTGQASR